MARFSTDVDILKHEPVLFGELHLPDQVQARGTGAALSGTTLTAQDADFVAAQIEAGGVIHLKSADGFLDGAYEIVSIDSATELTVSVVRADPADPAIAPHAAGDITYRVSTFTSQAETAAFELTQYFSIRPGNPASGIAVENILDTEGLRRASVYRIISGIYTSWATRPNGECFWRKGLLYAQLFEKARQRCHLTVDMGADGSADIVRIGGAIRLIRD
ncbi:MAG: hypothetical protein A2Y77_12610 [Planctomycetes bacterium RBG_13_62_9]|nr:MAG: hypothetical protein A2Y77_12610 [Planctomycetes bacterium RBG_13_62_9]